MANKPTEDTLQFLINMSKDDSVRPKIVRVGIMGRDSTGVWRNVLVSTDGKVQVA